MTLIEGHNIHKTYRLGRVDVPVLRGASITVQEGEWVAILGASGSGKSTLLHILGGLDRPDSRTESVVRFRGKAIGGLSGRALNTYRNTSVGFVFQFYHLLPELSVSDNVAVSGMVRYGARYAGKAREVRQRAGELLEAFGLAHRLNHRPAELSGGERQRVAIARALVNDPPLLLADEPTGNLDRKTGSAILDALAAHRNKTKRTMVIVTHDGEVAARADRIVRLEDGRIADGMEEASDSSRERSVPG
ncbi:MAG: ABC transporter ATP-binding protein [Phycisphaerales bacterium]